MRITENNSPLRIALRVLREIDMSDKDVSIRTYSNCREQGLHITYWGSDTEYPHRAVSFSENRSSDDIIVIYGMSDKFAGTGVPYDNEEGNAMWETRKYFSPGEYKKAGRFIKKWLTKGKVA